MQEASLDSITFLLKQSVHTICLNTPFTYLQLTSMTALQPSEMPAGIDKENPYMNQTIGIHIHHLRRHRGIGQGELAETLGVSVQAVSKWETGKANPDLYLLPKIAEYFGVSIDSLFADCPDAQELSDEEMTQLEINNLGWTEITRTNWRGTLLPKYGPYTPTEDQLHLLGDVQGKAVLEIGCGCGESLAWMKERNARELWGLDISAEQIAKAKELLADSGGKGRLFASPMETNPGIPCRYFDLVYSVYALGWTSDIDKTVMLISEYLKTGGHFIFSWDNPLLQCIDATDGRYLLSRSYVDEREITMEKQGSQLRLRNWKLSTYLNCLSSHGFLIEQVVEASDYDPAEADIFREAKYYSAGLARLINNTVIVKARKL